MEALAGKTRHRVAGAMILRRPAESRTLLIFADRYPNRCHSGLPSTRPAGGGTDRILRDFPHREAVNPAKPWSRRGARGLVRSLRRRERSELFDLAGGEIPL